MDPIEIFIDYGVIGILILMSILSVAIGIERFTFIKKVRPGDYENIKKLEITLTRHLYIIASIGSNAPYIGLLGTVLGIMFTFNRMGDMDTKSIMAGLSFALKATAAGLLVAIPSVGLYNTLLRRVKEKLAEHESKDEVWKRESSTTSM